MAGDISWLAVAHEAVDKHRALQKPAELGELLALAASYGVKRVVEIGSDAGGTLWAWRQLGAEVISVTLLDGPFGSGRPLIAHGAVVVEGDSHSFDTWLRVRDVLASQQADMLFVDGDHSYEGVAADVMAYSGFVRPDGLLVLHDIVNAHPSRPEPGPRQVWGQLPVLPGRRELDRKSVV